MGSTTARRTESGVLEPRAKRPRYTRGLLWDNEDDVLSTTAQYSLTAAPVPRVPFAESSNPIVQKTITDHPHLFKVDCHINVDRFEELLVVSPQPAICTVCVPCPPTGDMATFLLRTKFKYCHEK